MYENIDLFAQAMMSSVAENSDFTVTREWIQKLQNQSYNGMVCRKSGKDIGIVINLDMLFEACRTGRCMEDLLAEVLSVLHSPLADGPFANCSSADAPSADAPFTDAFFTEGFTVRDIVNYEKMRQFLRICLVPVKGNETLLQEIPHREIGDLAAVYRFSFKTDDGEPCIKENGRPCIKENDEPYIKENGEPCIKENGEPCIKENGRPSSRENCEASILIKNNMLRSFGITTDVLEKDALELSPKRFPLVVENLGVKLFAKSDTAGPLGFVGTEDGTQGAGVLAYPDTFAKIAGQLGSGYYIIPSSVHEVLVIADGEAPDTEVLDSMISEVNQNEVSPQERLSDHCYHYDPAEKRFETGKEYKKRSSLKKS